MDAFNKLSKNTQVVFVAAVLYLIFSFFDWQQVSLGIGTFGYTEWHGFGDVAALTVLVLIAWEISRVLDMKIPVGSLSPGLVSFGLTVLLFVFTVITFLTHGTARHWPAWVGLLLSIVVVAFGYLRSQEEGV